MAGDWNIRARDDRCTVCETPFSDGQTCCSVLTFEHDGYQRADYCAECRRNLADVDSCISAWRGVFKAPPPGEPEPVEGATAEGLLRHLMAHNAEKHANAIYILAVMLERKRVLTERAAQARDDGTLVRIYEHRKRGDMFSVRDPRLGLDQLEPVQAEVIALLGEPITVLKTAETPPPPVAEGQSEQPPSAELRPGFCSRTA